MKRKKAVIIVELVDESAEVSNDNIAKDLMNWFREDAVSIPWVKDVKGVTVKEE
ncbi:hypothetical protein MUO74_00970 [Candidatus Bathyarchaeota archaeon]|nr:hypothetical protein [Candidatus Bathyarchaeota archaeon]